MNKSKTKRKRGRPRLGTAYHTICVRIPLHLADPAAIALASIGAGWQRAFEYGLDSLTQGWRAAGRPDPHQEESKIS